MQKISLQSSRPRAKRSQLQRQDGVSPHGWFLCPAFIALALIFGGASAAGVLANALLQALAVLLILWMLWGRETAGRALPAKASFFLIAAIGMVIVQLLPLPSSLVVSLPGRDVAQTTLELANLDPVWLTLSMWPRATVTSALGLLPPLAVLLLSQRYPTAGPAVLLVIVAIGTVSMVLGVAQVVGGRTSPFYVYDITNRGSAVGLFANRNHLTTLLLIAIVAAATLLKLGIADGRLPSVRAFALFLMLALILSLGVIMTRSDAGVLLLGPTLIGALALLCGWRFGRAAVALSVSALAAGGVLFMVVGSSLLEMPDPSQSRPVIFSTTLRMIVDNLPFGSGLGTFSSLYPHYEDPTTVTRIFVNHAHNDYLELALETGFAGIALLAAVLLWWGWSAAKAWRSDHLIARAAALIIGIIAVHTLVDYPARTSAIACIAAFCCAHLLQPWPARSPPEMQNAAAKTATGSSGRD